MLFQIGGYYYETNGTENATLPRLTIAIANGCNYCIVYRQFSESFIAINDRHEEFTAEKFVWAAKCRAVKQIIARVTVHRGHNYSRVTPRSLLTDGDIN